MIYENNEADLVLKKIQKLLSIIFIFTKFIPVTHKNKADQR